MYRSVNFTRTPVVFKFISFHALWTFMDLLPGFRLIDYQFASAAKTAAEKKTPHMLAD